MTQGVNIEQVTKIIAETTKNQIRELKPKVLVELRDPDLITTNEDMDKDLGAHYKTEDINAFRITSIRTIQVGTRTALVELSTAIARAFKDVDLIKIGYLLARARVIPQILRYFRCHNLGYLSYNCTVDIRGVEICRKCRGEGHNIAPCKAPARCLLCVTAGLNEGRTGQVTDALGCP